MPTTASFSIAYPELELTNSALEIIDNNNNGNILSGQTNTVIVGQQMNLSYQLNITNASFNSSMFTNIQWTVPGYAISNFVYSDSSGVVYTNFPTTNSNAVFYWVDGATNRILQCCATIDGTTISNEAIFNIARPSATITTSTGAVGVFGDELLFAPTNAAQPNGIEFSNTFSIPSGFSGTNLWIQVCYYRVRQFLDTNMGWHYETENGQSPYGDTPIPYARLQGLTPGDSPNEPLPDSGYLQCDATNTFEMWMMFQPNNGIPVPLCSVNWSWSGIATNVPFGDGSTVTWSLANGTDNVSPVDPDTQTFPVWNSDIHDRQWQPPGQGLF